MNCEEAREMLAGYSDGELSPVENEALATHLQTCGRCRQIVHDQQRVQHVFDQYPVPTVSDEEWDAIGKALRTELTSEGAAVALKTQPRVEGLDAAPSEPEAEPEAPSEPAADTEETAAPPEVTPPPGRLAREVPPPGPGPERAAVRHPAPTLIVHRGRPLAGPSPLRWTAHLVGLAAAAAVILLGLAGILLDRAPPLEPSALARQGDVEILELECDPMCSVVLQTGDAGDVMAIWVEPENPDG